MKTQRIANVFFFIVAAVPLLALLFVMLSRWSYPFELEWMEGGMITHAARALRGEPIYAEPRVDFVAFFYPPLYSYITALLSFLTGGLSFALARGVSVCATLGTLGLLTYIGKREANLATGVLAAGLYAAHFRMAGAFYDLARPDALALFWLVASIACLRYVPARKGLISAIACAVCAFFTKQTMAVFVPAVALATFLEDRKRGLIYGLCALVISAALGELVDVLHGGWFRFYIIEGHQGHMFLWKNFTREYWRDVFFLSPLLLTVPVVALVWDRAMRWLLLIGLPLLAVGIYARLTEIEFGPHMYYDELLYGADRPFILVLPLVTLALVFVGGLIRGKAEPLPRFVVLFWGAGALSSALNHSTQWAYSNCFMPIALASSLLIALTLHRIANVVEDRLRTSLAVVISFAGLLVGLAPLRYVPSAQIPTQEDRDAIASLHEQLQPYGDKIWMPAHPFFIVEQGGPIYSHQMGLGDVEFGGGLSDLSSRLQQSEWSAIVLNEGAGIPGLDESYRIERTIRWPSPDAAMPRTGFRTRPRWIWVPKNGRGTR